MDTILDNFRLYFPNVAKRMVSYKETNDFEITVVCDDGYVFVYDDLEKSIRNLPSDEDVMNEKIWRREFGYRLSKRMRRKGFTQEELANEVGVSRVMLSNYITGRNMPSFYIVDKLARVLDCSVDDLRQLN